MLKPGLIQVAGVIDQAEAELLIDCGVKYLGFPLRLPVNEEDLSETEAAALIARFPVSVHGVLITYLDRADAVITFCRELDVSHVQLHGPIAVDELVKIKNAAPDLILIKSLVVREDNLDDLTSMIAGTAPYVDAYITDSFDPDTGAEGATGKTHDWDIDKLLVTLSPRPVILAGGLDAGNVREAILHTHAFGVDVHTGIEGPDGRKDRTETLRFVSEARAAFAEITS